MTIWTYYRKDEKEHCKKGGKRARREGLQRVREWKEVQSREMGHSVRKIKTLTSLSFCAKWRRVFVCVVVFSAAHLSLFFSYFFTCTHPCAQVDTKHNNRLVVKADTFYFTLKQSSVCVWFLINKGVVVSSALLSIPSTMEWLWLFFFIFINILIAETVITTQHITHYQVSVTTLFCPSGFGFAAAIKSGLHRNENLRHIASDSHWYKVLIQNFRPTA